MEIEDKVAIVTGGSRGIGAAIAVDLARHGAHVAITYQSQEAKALQLVSAIEGLGRKACCFQADASDFEAAQRIVGDTVERLGHVDILVNNAGVNWDGVSWKMTEEQWDRVIGVDLKGCFNYSRAVAPIFRDQKHGKIVNITSINGLRGKFGQTNYSAAKAGIIGYTKALARELGRSNVNVNAVAPGFIRTEMYEVLPDAVKEQALGEIVLGRAGTAEEVAFVVTFLCTEKARHITGEVLKVDGGQYI
ncbi:MAG: 3-oxoacyl-ACP reductase FabG [Candidatus Tectomicrobia bacterium]|nr:3-oxoacyl-ACP reductase FabG [Candidatus Tectomicrobia bacterium]